MTADTTEIRPTNIGPIVAQLCGVGATATDCEAPVDDCINESRTPNPESEPVGL